MREVDLSRDLSHRLRSSLRALGLLAGSMPIDEWCLVGGMMVLIAARAEHTRLERSEQTMDVDVVVDVAIRPRAVGRAARTLRTFGYDIPPDAWDHEDIMRCTFASAYSQVDVLCPDDASNQDLDGGEGIQSIAIPGGRRALELAEPIQIFYDETEADVILRVPLLPGALVVKAHAAISPKTADQPRHIQDVAALLSVVEDPTNLGAQLAQPDLTVVSPP